MKIYLGNNNIASLFDDLRAGFEKKGHDVFTMSVSSSLIKSPVDLPIKDQINAHLSLFDKKCPHASAATRERFIQDCHEKLLNLALAKAVEADVCIFIWNSFIPLWGDLPLLRKHNTKVAVCFAGSEARVLPLENLFRRITGAPPANSACKDMETTLQLVRYAERNADAVLGASMAGLRPSYIPITTILNADLVPCHVNRDRNVPVILHAPSHKTTKGTAIWNNIFSELKEEGHKFIVRFVENVPHLDFLKLYKHVDIVCDGLIHGGKQAREAMAGGCAVLSAFGNNAEACKKFFLMDDDTLRSRCRVETGSPEDAAIAKQHMKKAWYFYPEVNPCMSVSPETAKESLRMLLLDRNRRIALAQRGRDVIEKYCSPSMVAEDILQCITEPQSFLTQTLLSFHHSLLYHDYIPSSQHERDILNRTTDIVRNCEWYTSGLKPLLRAGLHF